MNCSWVEPSDLRDRHAYSHRRSPVQIRSALGHNESDERDEHEMLLDVCVQAMQSPEPAPAGEAA